MKARERGCENERHDLCVREKDTVSVRVCDAMYVCIILSFLDGYYSTVQGLLDWFEVDLGFTKLSFIQIDLRALCDVM